MRTRVLGDFCSLVPAWACLRHNPIVKVKWSQALDLRVCCRPPIVRIGIGGRQQKLRYNYAPRPEPTGPK